MAKSRLYRGFRFPSEIISHIVWLYFRFALSFRDVEELMASRGIFVSYETIRQWTLRFGQHYANEQLRRQPRQGDRWHLDEVVLTIKGKHHYLWHAVDQNSHTLDVLVQSRRNRQAAKRFFRKLLKGLRYSPRVVITDKLKSYAAAKVQVMLCVEHRQHKGSNNRAVVAPTDAAARTTDAPVQVAWPRAAISGGTRLDQQCLSLPAQPPVGAGVPARPHSGIFTLELDH